MPTLKTEACILAGGLSSRMGRDKSRLKLGTETLAERAVASARRAGLDVRIVRRDLLPPCGPLSGIHAALSRSSADQVLFLACDMPFVSHSLLGRILRRKGARTAAAAAGPDGQLGFPFVLDRKALPAVERAIARGRYSLQALLRELEALPVRVLRRSTELVNVNTPAEWSEAQAASLPDRTTGRSAILKVEQVSVQRGGTRILQQVSWRINPGEHWIVLGANGSGKTSLLSALTGYLPPTTGTISVLDKRYGQTDWRELRREIGLVSSSIRQLMAESEPALQTVVSGRYAMIDYWGRITPPDRRRGLHLLRQIECLSLRDRPWGYLSQGERQRILIGRALMAKPRLLILDEPCAGLDPAAREHFLQFLQRLGSSPSAPTLIFVTHHVEEIMPVFTHVLILKGGKILAAGDKRKVLSSRTLAAAFGSDLRLRARAGRYRLEILSGARGVL